MDALEKQLRELYSDKHLPVFEISEILGIKIDQINYLRRKYGIPKLERFERHNLVLTDLQKRIILGTVLGDGCLHQKDSYHRLLLEHSLDQKAYLDWKIAQLSSIFKVAPHFCEKSCTFEKKDGKERTCKVKSYAITSISHPELTQLANQIYDIERTKHITTPVLDFIGWEGLAVYYQDDGSACENITFHVCNFDLTSINTLKIWLETFGIKACIAGKPKEYNLILNESSKTTFLNKISPYILPFFRYKTISVRKDHSIWNKDESCAICLKKESKKMGNLCQRCYSEIHRKGYVIFENSNWIVKEKGSEICFLREVPNDEVFQKLRKYAGRTIYYKDFDPRLVKINFSEYRVRRIEIQEAALLLKKFHYHRQARRGDSLAVGLFWKEILVGVVIFGRTVRDRIPASLNKICSTNFQSNEVFELTRFVLTDGLPTNTGSYFFTRCLPFVRELKISLLIAYSDTTQGHQGCLYKACNWIHVGTSYPNYHYVEKKTKQLITRSRAASLAKQIGINENDYASQNGLEPELEKFKHKYIYPISRKSRAYIIKAIAKIPVVSPPTPEENDVIEETTQPN